MELISEKNQCCGCEVCGAVCPKKAITFNEDEEGFLYPTINEYKCCDCGQCKRACAFQTSKKNKNEFNKKFEKIYAVKHRDHDVRMKSRSGGIFTAISDIVLEKGGVVYGATYDESMEVVHVRAETKEVRNQMRGSKYVQSKTDSEIYSKIKQDLQEKREVLYSGTSCQIAALKSFLGSKYNNLICIDIVCHGVPSPKVFRDYLKYWEVKTGEKIRDFDFRNKKDYGWAGHVESVFTKNKKKDSCLYTMLFYQHNILRPSCYVCPYKGLEHPGDITIADYWGIDVAAPGFSDNKGVSLVLVNTELGEKYFQGALNDYQSIEAIPTEIEKSMQPPLKEPFKEPVNRVDFWNDYNLHGFNYIAQKYAGNSWKWIIKYRLKKILMDLKIYKVTK